MKKIFLPLLFVFSFLKKLLLFPHHHLARLLHASREEKNYCLKMSDISPLSLARVMRLKEQEGTIFYLLLLISLFSAIIMMTSLEIRSRTWWIMKLKKKIPVISRHNKISNEVWCNWLFFSLWCANNRCHLQRKKISQGAMRSGSMF